MAGRFFREAPPPIRRRLLREVTSRRLSVPDNDLARMQYELNLRFVAEDAFDGCDPFSISAEKLDRYLQADPESPFAGVIPALWARTHPEGEEMYFHLLGHIDAALPWSSREADRAVEALLQAGHRMPTFDARLFACTVSLRVGWPPETFGRAADPVAEVSRIAANALQHGILDPALLKQAVQRSNSRVKVSIWKMGTEPPYEYLQSCLRTMKRALEALSSQDPAWADWPAFKVDVESLRAARLQQRGEGRKDGGAEINALDEETMFSGPQTLPTIDGGTVSFQDKEPSATNAFRQKARILLAALRSTSAESAIWSELPEWLAQFTLIADRHALYREVAGVPLESIPTK
jgi:hypothetical protein